MSLLNQKANYILSKITFAKERIDKTPSSDEILQSYLKPLNAWLDTLRERTESAKTSFEEFVRDTDFAEEQHLRDEPQRRLLSDILRDFEDIDRRLYIGVDTFLPLILVWNAHRKEKEIRKQHSLLRHFLLELLQTCRISEPMMIILGESYECLPVEWGEKIKHVVFVPYCETRNPRKWVILAHEIGHACYDLNAAGFSSIFSEIAEKLTAVKPINLEQKELESAIYAWTRHWVPELFSDCFAVRTLGPAFVAQFIVTVLDSQPNRLSFSHPPPSLRVKCMLETLDSLNLSDVDVDSYQNKWESYCFTTSRPSSLYIVHEEVVKAAVSGINSILQESPVEKRWPDILYAKKDLDRGAVPDQDLLAIVSAMAIAEPSNMPDQTYEALLKRYSSNPDVS